jgi:hypothetical protein
MSIDEGFKKLLDGVRMADEGRDEIMRGLEEAWSGRKDLDVQLAELRDTVTSLEALVFEQSKKIDDLRNRMLPPPG